MRKRAQDEHETLSGRERDESDVEAPRETMGLETLPSSRDTAASTRSREASSETPEWLLGAEAECTRFAGSSPARSSEGAQPVPKPEPAEPQFCSVVPEPPPPVRTADSAPAGAAPAAVSPPVLSPAREARNARRRRGPPPKA